MNRKTPLSSVQPLPSDFAEKILKLEISVDINSDIDSFKSLLELYSQAVEYYESIKDPRFKYYKQRMDYCITKQSNNLLKPETEVNAKEKRYAEETIKQHERNSEIITREIVNSLERQNSLVMARFYKRKRNSSFKKKIAKAGFPSDCHKRTNSDYESDKSAGVCIEDRFQTELERIMEKNVFEKIRRTKEIRDKYEEAVREIGSGCGIVQTVVDEIRRSMEEELRQMEIELEIKRKDEIALIKKRVL